MSSVTLTSTSRPNFTSIFNVALDSYRRKTKKDLASHPLLPRLQSCGSTEAILDVFREQIPALNKSQNIDGGFTEWVIPTVNVLHSFSDILGQAVGLAFPPANIIFAGISVLLSAAKDASACQDKLIDIFNHIERFFQRLGIYTGITPTTDMMDMIVEIMVEVINILAIATKEVKCGRLKKYFRKLMRNTDLEDSLEKLDKLTQEEARMASAESLRVAHSVDGKVMAVDTGVKAVGNRVKVVEEKVQDVHGDVQDVGNKVQGIEASMQAVQDDMKDVGSRMQIVGSDIQDISSEVRDVDDKLDRVNRNQLRDGLLRWLSPPDPSVNHNIAYKARHSGTAEWFFQGSVFNEWKSTGSFLWIHGKPGSGKSILCSAVIQNIVDSCERCDAGRALMAYFYFDFKDVDKQNLRNLLPSLLTQLSAQSDSCFDVLTRLYSGHDDGVRKPSDRAMIDCLKEMLSLGEKGPTYIIMDALDECPVASTIPPSPREEVLDFVEELVGLHLPNLRICVTSRPEHDIQVALETLSERPVSLHDESGQQKDIADYVAFFVDSNRRMQRWRKEDKDLVIKTLSEKADGMFQWAFCQLEVLRHCFPPSVRRTLDDLPESLDETYERILREIRKPNQEHAHRMLQCLVAAVRPLKVEELAEVLAFDFDAEGIPRLNLDWRWENQEEAIMSACSSLVIIVEDGDSRIVQFSHFSVKEFLTANRLAEPVRDVSRYHIQLDAAHTILAQASLGVVLGLGDRIDREKIKSFPLALYAGQHWTTHAQFETVSSRIKGGMERLFDADQPHFAIWLWLYDEEAVLLKSLSSMCPEKPQAVPLYYAAKFGFRDLAEHLIAENPDHIYARGGSKETPMHVAAGAGHINILSLLLDHGADVDVRNKNGETPLLRASWAGQHEAGWYLIDRGADINAPDQRNFTPVFVAFKGHVESARMLLERGAVIDIRNCYGDTPLHQALRWEKIEIEFVRLFLEHGANPNLANRYGDTPFEMALRFEEPEIVKLLSEYGGKPVEHVNCDLILRYNLLYCDSVSQL